MLYDIIKNIKTSLKTNDDYRRFLEANQTIEEYIDGLQLNVIKVANNGDINDWIISHKGQVFYPGEFEYQREADINKTLGISKIKKVFNHFSKIKKNDIEINTDLIIMFITNCQNVKLNYGLKGNLVLLGHTKTAPIVKYGKLNIINNVYETTRREEFAEILGLETPRQILEGVLYPTINFERSITDDELRSVFYQSKPILQQTEEDYERYFNLVCNILLKVKPMYNTRDIEIIVINKRTDKPLKIQYDSIVSNQDFLKYTNKYVENNEEIERKYWKELQGMALGICTNVKTDDINKGLTLISQYIKKLNVTNLHTKKNEATIKDDLASLTKEWYLKGLSGNDGSIVVGKFRVFTNEHKKIIEEALENSDHVTVCILENKEPDTLNFRKQMVKKIFPKVDIITVKGNNILSIIKQINFNINKVFCFSKQYKDYLSQLENSNGIVLKEVVRDKGSLYADEIIKNISDKEYFMNNTPDKIHSFYDKIKKTYLNDSNLD